MTADETTPTAGAESAQGTPDEPAAPAGGDFVAVPAAPAFGDLVTDDVGDGDRVRLGLFLTEGVVLWLGEPARCDWPLRRIG